MYGWTGKILRIDLSRRNCSVEDLPFGLARQYIGGRGLGDRILFDEVDPRTDPLSPENKLIFATGPMTGTGVPAGGRFIVVGKSPLTGAIANPCCGGYLGANLKFAGYDVIIVEGKSPEPVYISIVNDTVEIRPAAHLWGKGATETEHAIRARMGPEADGWEKNILSVATIGPAGENLVRFACIMADGGRAAGRSGLGAVMGSKNLKAVTAHGTGEIRIPDPEAFKQAFQDFLREARENKELEKRSMWGTWSLPGRANKSKTQAALNFQDGYFEPFTKFEDPAYIRNALRVRDEGCFACPFRCGKRSRISDPEYPWTAKGPEHESMALLGSNCGIGDLEDIFRANFLCNELGMDTITTGATVSCAMELFENGILSLFMGVKKQGMPAWHPQGVEVLGLQYATSNVGACHTKATLPFYEGRKDPAHHVELTKKDQDYVAIVDSGVLCWIIYHGPLWNEKPLQWLRLTTGIDYSAEDLALTGERIWNLERLFNFKAGLTGKDDTLPRRITEEPRVKNQVVHLSRMLPEYYQLRGWDGAGVPTQEKLRELGLEKEGAGLS